MLPDAANDIFHLMIAEAIERLTSSLGDTHLVAVSKFHPAEAVMEAYRAGQRRFGENRVQELMAKQPILPADIEWHFIGHLQTNKVRQVVGLASIIESVDSPRLLELIDRESARKGVVTDVLLQLHVAMEETKFGFLPSELDEYMASGAWRTLPNVRLRGVMGMASNVDDRQRVAEDFRTIRSEFDRLRMLYGLELPQFDTVSMGMSHDWPLAVQEGATSVRIGTDIFGPRQY